MRRSFLVSLSLICLIGCSSRRVKYYPATELDIPSKSNTVVVYGNIDKSIELLQQANLPHHTFRKKCELRLDSFHELTKQLGNDDYIFLGEMVGSGSARANLNSLIEKMAKKSAKKGGDILLIYNYGVSERPWSYVAPGYSSTSTQGSASGWGNYNYRTGQSNAYVIGQSTSNTSYMPPVQYSGVNYFPHARGYVFRYRAKAKNFKLRILNLSDSNLQKICDYMDEVDEIEDLGYDEAYSMVDRYLTSLEQPD